MQQPFPLCPICGGTQAFFKGVRGDASIKIILGDFLDGSIRLGVLICLTCGHAEIRPDPQDMELIRSAARRQRL